MPATGPRLLILVTVDEPQGAIFGGVVAAPVFQQIARFALQYLEVPPDNPSELKSSAPASVSTAASLSTTSPSSPSATTTSGPAPSTSAGR